MRFEDLGKRTLELVFDFVDHLSTSIEASTLIPLLGVRGQTTFWGAWKTHLVSLLFVLGYGDYIIDENIPIKGYGLDPYFRSAAVPSDAPPPLPVHLAACEGLAGGS